MGLAPYGEPKYEDLIKSHLIDIKADGSFKLDMSYFDYCIGLTMTNSKFNNLFGGPPRKPEAELSQREMDLAASVQKVTEEVIVKLAKNIASETGDKNLCLAGGVALNCVANGKILKEKKMLPTKLTEVAKSTPKSMLGRTTKINEFDLSLVLQQQAILIQSGLPLEDAMRMTIEQAETDRQKRMVESWRSEIIEGRSFSEAMRLSPYKIPESVLAGVGVGEESGHLHTVLSRLAEDIETSAENKKTVTRALIYPATLLGASMLVVSMMMVWVVPKITAIFISSNRELPTITKIIIAISDFTQQYGLYLLLLGLILGGTISSVGQRKEDLLVDSLVERVNKEKIEEVILATSATVEGQTTAYYVQDSLKGIEVKITKLAQGLPVGGEIESLDDGTLFSAFKNRSNLISNSD